VEFTLRIPSERVAWVSASRMQKLYQRGTEAVTEYKMLAPRMQEPIPGVPYYQWISPKGAVFSAFYRTAHGYLLRFPNLADFEIPFDGPCLTCIPELNIPEATTLHLYLDQVLPLILSSKGKIVLHGSCVVSDGYAFGFLGPSGRGKSTLAASFAINGCPFLADDGLVIEPDGSAYLVMPSHPSLRLWEDSEDALLLCDARKSTPVHYTTKSSFMASSELDYCGQPKFLKALYFLAEDNAEEVSIQPLDPAPALVNLLKHSFILDVDDRPSISANFDRLARLANKVACFALSFPRRYETLPMVTKAIRANSI